jgi:zinc protease
MKEFMSMRRLIVPALFVLCATALQPVARGQAKPDLPTAETVLNQYVEATGGKAAYKKLKNRVVTGTIEIPAANIKGKTKVMQAEPNKFAMVAELGPAGEVRRVCDGTNAWELSTLGGDRELAGDEKAAFLREADFYKDLHWKELNTKVECVGIEDLDGKPAYKIVLTPKSGKPTTEYYDKTSHLLVKKTSTTPSPMGDVQAEEFPTDYKAVDGVLFPFKITQKVLTQEVVMTLTEVKHNVELPADAFNRPAATDEPAKKKAG